MTSGRFVFAGTLALAALAGVASAQAAPCVAGPASGFNGTSCSVGNVVFGNIHVSAIPSGNGTVALGDFVPVSTPTESGLELTYTATAGPSPPIGSADVAWTYTASTITGSLDDASLSVTGSVTGTGRVVLDEFLRPSGVSLHASIPGSAFDHVTFSPVASLSVTKDLSNFTGSAGSATSSIITNEFSTTSHVVPPVPEPASLALLGAGLVGLGLIRGRRKTRD